VGPKELLIAAIIQVIGYTFNEVINEQKIQTFDAGGSTIIHAFGAYFGLAVSWMLSKKNPPHTKAESNSDSNTIAMIGTLFLWMYWPSFNFAGIANNFYEQNQIVTNTIYSLIGSCLSTFMMTSFLGKKLLMEDILNATLAGGVIVGASTGILYQPAAAIAIGLFGGIISTLGFHYLTPFLESKLKLNDTCGIHNLHGIPGALGGIISAIVMASYNSGFDPTIAAAFSPENNPVTTHQGTFLNQGGLQLAGTFVSVGFGLAFGILAGYIVNMFYNEKSDNFFEDKAYIHVEEGE
jgi:ammonium transporter Rh